MLLARRNGMVKKNNKKPAYWGLTFTAEQANSTISMTKGAKAPTLNLVTSVNNGKTWETFTPGETTITLVEEGDSVWFAAGSGGNTRTAAGSAMESYANRFVMAGSISASGSVMSLLNASEPTYECDSQNTFAYLFLNCTSLTTAPVLPAETLASDCYSSMFRACTSLTTAPALPAETLASYCYSYMFYGCTSLTTAPVLPATTLARSCYRYMFFSCTALTTPPPTLPATALTGTYTYQYMFCSCSNLEKAPVICLTTTPNTTQQMRYMFQNCSKLKEIEIHITSWPTTATIMGDWVKGVAATGTFKCPAALGTDSTITRGTSKCPTGWTVVNI